MNIEDRVSRVERTVRLNAWCLLFVGACLLAVSLINQGMFGSIDERLESIQWQLPDDYIDAWEREHGHEWTCMVKHGDPCTCGAEPAPPVEQR